MKSIMNHVHKRARGINPMLALLVSLSIIGMVPTTVRAQEITGAITGTVIDPSGAAVPGAQVTATNVLQGTTWPTQTNPAGIYNFPRLPVGPYTVKVEAKGFATSIRESFELQMNQIARVNIQLTVGTIAQQISVTAATPLLQTDAMQVGLVTSANLNVNLPLATRNYVQLTLLTPGTMTTDPSSFENGLRTQMGSGKPYINGNREEANNFLLNGIYNNEICDNVTAYQPSPDAVQEFNVITNNAPAQYGQFQGGVISVNIKSGTDHYHGNLFEFLRNDHLNANNWARDWQHLVKPGMRWNEFGGTFGGPIKKGKFFFFADYQGQRFDNPPVTNYITVMTMAERNGDFSQLLSAKGIQLYSPCANLTGACTSPSTLPSLRTAYLNNQITNTIDPVAKALFASSYYPQPVNSGLQFNALNTSSSAVNNDQGDLKVDYVVNQHNLIWGDYSEGFQDNPGYNSVALLGQTYNYSPFHYGVINWTHTFSPNMVMEAKIGVNRIPWTNGVTIPGVGNLSTQLGIAGFKGPGLLGLNFSGGLANAVGTANVVRLLSNTTIEPVVDLILTKNRHTIHVGFQAMRQNINAYLSGTGGKNGYLTFNGQYTGGANPAAPTSKGFAEADFYLGFPQDIAIGVQQGTWGQRSWVLSPYVQDDWRATEHLTFNLGLRWEWNQPWYEVFNRQANFGMLSGTEYIAGQSGCPYSDCRALYNGYNRDFEPRIGFSWSPTFLGKSVVRGAYTISSFLEGTGANLRLPLNPPFNLSYETTYNTGNQLYFPGSTTGQGLSILTSPSNPLVGANIRLWDPNVRPDTVQQWNFSVERQLPSDTLFSLSYVGQHGTHLMVPMPYLQKELPGVAGCPSSATSPCGSPYLAGNPAVYNVIGQISGTASSANQAYAALQASLTKHMSKGLELQLSYTYSKTMTNALGYYGQAGQAAPNIAYRQNLYDMRAEWGPAYFDSTHAFVGAYVYQLPFGKGEKYGANWNPVARAFLGSWQLSGIISFHTGFPMTITANDASGTKGRGPRANCNGPVTYPHGVGLGTTWFSTSVFSQPSAGKFGTCAIGTVRGPGLSTWDMSIEKQFPITESKRLAFRSEFINFTNTPIFQAPTQGVTSSTFGQVLTSQGERNIQFALKFYF